MRREHVGAAIAAFTVLSVSPSSVVARDRPSASSAVRRAADAEPATPAQGESLTAQAARLLPAGEAWSDSVASARSGSSSAGGRWRALPPPARSSNALMAYHAARKAVVMYDGSTGDSWAFSRGTWSWIPGEGPMPRTGASMVYDSGGKRLVLFGGISTRPQNPSHLGETWVLGGSGQWVQIGSPPPPSGNGTGPPARRQASMAYVAHANKVVLFGGFGCLSLRGSGLGRTPEAVDEQLPFTTNTPGWCEDTWTLSGNTWTQTTSPGPSSREDPAMAYDPAANKVVLFGGSTQRIINVPKAGVGVDINGRTFLADTWTFDGDTWTETGPTSLGPPGRDLAAAVYHDKIDRVVLFGGRCGTNVDCGDTWLFDGSTWTQGSAGPRGRTHMSTSYDAAAGKLVVFGGTCDHLDCGDTWLFNGSTWSQAPVFVAPSQRRRAAMVYDPATRKIVLFGGSATQSGLREDVGDTWLFDGARWTEWRATRRPAPRDRPSMVYHPKIRRVVLFGGQRCGDNSSDCGDTWLFDGSRWTELRVKSGQGPQPRFNAAMEYDAATGKVVLFGGAQTNTLPPDSPDRCGASSSGSPGQRCGDTWLFDGSRWTKARGGGPPARAGATLTYHAAARALVLWGGLTCGITGVACGDTWVYARSRWSPVLGAGPPARTLAAVAYHAAAGALVVVGGECKHLATSERSTPECDDAWVFKKNFRWTKLKGPLPQPRKYVAAVYDSAARRVVLWGGRGYEDGRDKRYEDTWTFDGSTWSKLATAGPPGREAPLMAYSAALGEVLLFGGFTGGADDRCSRKGCDDSWRLRGKQWSPVPGASPVGRTAGSILPFPDRGQIVLFSGTPCDGIKCDDTWTFSR